MKLANVFEKPLGHAFIFLCLNGFQHLLLEEKFL